MASSQQQQQSKLGSMKPKAIGKATSKFVPLYGGSLLKGKQIGKPLKSFGKGFGGEPKTSKMKSTKINTKKTVPSKAKVMSSLKKTMGY